MKHVKRRYRPTLDDQFDKQKSSGRTPSDKNENDTRKPFTFQDSKAPEKISYELFFHSVVPRLVNRCQGSCGDKLFPVGKEGYFVVKSRGGINFMNKQGEMDSILPTVYPFQG